MKQSLDTLDLQFAQNETASLPRKCKAADELREMQQERLKKATELVLSLSSVLMLSNRNSKHTSYLNTVTAYLFKNAITSTATGLNINYRKVFVSKGNLPRGELAHTKASLASIQFTWDDNSAGNNERKRDRAILVAYCEALNRCVYVTWGARRADEEAMLEVPQFHGQEVQTWLSFISADSKSISSSMYAGSVTLSDFR